MSIRAVKSTSDSVGFEATAHQLGNQVKQTATEVGVDVWEGAGTDLPYRIDTAINNGKQVFHKQSAKIEGRFSCDSLQLNPEARRIFEGIKASGARWLLNEQQEAILKNYREKYRDRFKKDLTQDCKYAHIGQLGKFVQNERKKKGAMGAFAWRGLDRIDFRSVRQYFLFLYEEFRRASFSEVVESMRELCDYREALVAEVLAHVLAYTEGLHGRTLCIPVIDQNKIKLIKYTIKDSRLGDDLPCYLLESSDPKAKPWLIIRGTQRFTGKTSDGCEFRTGARESLMTDIIDASGIAEDVVTKALVTTPIVRGKSGQLEQRESIGDFLVRCKREGKQLNLAGHSLGGTLITYIASQFPNQVHKAYSFSSPGISDCAHRIYKQLRKKTGIVQDPKQKIINFLYQNDPIHLVGRWQIGHKLSVVPLNPLPQRGMVEAHIRPHLNHDFELRRLHSKSENYKFARYISEFVRWFLGSIVYFCVWVLKPSAIPDWYRNRHVYRIRRSDYLKLNFPEYA